MSNSFDLIPTKDLAAEAPQNQNRVTRERHSLPGGRDVLQPSLPVLKDDRERTIVAMFTAARGCAATRLRRPVVAQPVVYILGGVKRSHIGANNLGCCREQERDQVVVDIFKEA